MTQTKVLLWLDDERDPFSKRWEGWHGAPTENLKIIWVKSFIQFMDAINNNPWVDYISFSYDLCKEHRIPERYWQSYPASKAYQDTVRPQYISKTGEDCAKWLVDFCRKNEIELPQFFIYSANPVGANRILKVLTDYLREQIKVTAKV